jgi:hypothetical protein
MALTWECPASPACEDAPAVAITFTYAADPAKRFTSVMLPIAHWVDGDRPLVRVTDEVPIAAPDGLPSGDYRVWFSVAPADGAPAVEGPPVTLVPSKRQALRDMLVNRRIDWGLLTRILLTV